MKHFYYFFEGKHTTPPLIKHYKSTSYITDTLFQALMQCIGIFTIPFYFHSGDKKVFLLIKNMLNNKN